MKLVKVIFLFICLFNFTSRIQGKEKVAIIDFTEKGNVKKYHMGKIIADLIKVALSGNFNLADHENINKVLREKSFCVNEIMKSDDEGKLFAETVETNKLIAGNVSTKKKTILVDIKVFDANSGTWSEKTTAEYKSLGEIPYKIPILLQKLKLINHTIKPLSSRQAERQKSFSTLLLKGYAAMNIKKYKLANKYVIQAEKIPGYNKDKNIVFLKQKIISELKKNVDRKTNSWLKNLKGCNITTPRINMKFVYVAPGKFKMGNKTIHDVTINKPYWIGKYEVTRRKYNQILGHQLPKNVASWNKPVNRINWYTAVKACKLLTKTARKTGMIPPGYEYRLPTEIEWEFAARGGNLGKGFNYSGSNDARRVVWNKHTAKRRLRNVGTKKPNELGIHDMSGNVYEWCLDNYDKTRPEGNVKKDDSSIRVCRGGGYTSPSKWCTVYHRSRNKSSHKAKNLGFRIVLGPTIENIE